MGKRFPFIPQSFIPAGRTIVWRQNHRESRLEGCRGWCNPRSVHADRDSWYTFTVPMQCSYKISHSDISRNLQQRFRWLWLDFKLTSGESSRCRTSLACGLQNSFGSTCKVFNSDFGPCCLGASKCVGIKLECN